MQSPSSIGPAALAQLNPYWYIVHGRSPNTDRRGCMRMPSIGTSLQQGHPWEIHHELVRSSRGCWMVGAIHYGECMLDRARRTAGARRAYSDVLARAGGQCGILSSCCHLYKNGSMEAEILGGLGCCGEERDVLRKMLRRERESRRRGRGGVCKYAIESNHRGS